ncbi:MAG: hypothetical protein HFI70_10630, partial [Lachnospiraceae bacterium]|nr:hypothetical protein [Lachnospiraceae bacterium]
MENNNDNGGFLWGLLGCCIPVVGLILFLVWKDQKPKTAKAAGIGALVSVILSVVFYITQTSHIKNVTRTLKNQYFSSQISILLDVLCAA